MRARKQTQRPKEPAGMDPAEIFAALELLEKERGIPRTFMLEKISQAIVAAYKKDHPGVDNVEVDADEDHKTLRMFIIKTVVEEEDYVDPGNEILLEEARKIYAKYEPGDTVDIPVDNVEFGRIAAGNGKQVIIQGLREAERGRIYDEFDSKQHEILTGTVIRIDPRTGNATLRIGTGADATEAVLAAGEQLQADELQEEMKLRVYVVDVRRTTRGPQILISRTHPGLVRRLFEMEVPEIYDGIVEVRSIAREAGSRTKIAVSSNDEAVDAIGSCVGPRGGRVNHVVEELRGEKIDIIQYSDDPKEFVAAALAPADVIEVELIGDNKACRVRVPDDQLSLAIGREGQNARLAARLTGYKIDIKPLSWQEESEDSEDGEETGGASGETPVSDGERPEGSEGSEGTDAPAETPDADADPRAGDVPAGAGADAAGDGTDPAEDGEDPAASPAETEDAAESGTDSVPDSVPGEDARGD